jgi:transcriptional regulator of acetoin/glycerol metabolism
LSSSIRIAWREWAGSPLPRQIATRLASLHWKGGEAELLSFLKMAAILGISTLNEHLLLSGSSLVGVTPWKTQKRHLEKHLVFKALQEAGGNRTRAAKALGVHRNTLLWHLRRLKVRLDAQPRPK